LLNNFPLGLTQEQQLQRKDAKLVRRKVGLSKKVTIFLSQEFVVGKICFATLLPGVFALSQ